MGREEKEKGNGRGGEGNCMTNVKLLPTNLRIHHRNFQTMPAQHLFVSKSYMFAVIYCKSRYLLFNHIDVNASNDETLNFTK